MESSVSEPYQRPEFTPEIRELVESEVFLQSFGTFHKWAIAKRVLTEHLEEHVFVRSFCRVEISNTVRGVYKEGPVEKLYSSITSLNENERSLIIWLVPPASDNEGTVSYLLKDYCRQKLSISHDEFGKFWTSVSDLAGRRLLEGEHLFPPKYDPEFKSASDALLLKPQVVAWFEIEDPSKGWGGYRVRDDRPPLKDPPRIPHAPLDQSVVDYIATKKPESSELLYTLLSLRRFYVLHGQMEVFMENQRRAVLILEDLQGVPQEYLKASKDFLDGTGSFLVNRMLKQIEEIEGDLRTIVDRLGQSHPLPVIDITHALVSSARMDITDQPLIPLVGSDGIPISIIQKDVTARAIRSILSKSNKVQEKRLEALPEMT